MKIVLLLAVALLLCSCHRNCLTCRSEFLYPTYLASVQAKTPDPTRGCFYGQQVIAFWRLNKSYKQNLPLTLLLHVRYGTRELETISVPITTIQGWWTYRLVNQDYWCKEGILSFQAQLLDKDQIIDQWTHHIWADIIELIPSIDGINP